jgi:hypothetical protein
VVGLLPVLKSGFSGPFPRSFFPDRQQKVEPMPGRRLLRTEGVWGDQKPLSHMLAEMWADIEMGEPLPIVETFPDRPSNNLTAVQSHWMPYQAHELWHECRISEAARVLLKHHPAVATIETDWPEWQWVSYPTAIDVVCGMAATILDQTDLAAMSADDATAAVQSRLPKVDGRTAAEIHARLMQELQEVAHILDATSPDEIQSEPQEVQKPENIRWDADNRKLWFDDKCLAAFAPQINNGGVPSILGAFQDDAWPDCIDNPVTNTGASADSRDRTKNAVKALNKKFEESGCRSDFGFSVDGERIIFSRPGS